MGADEMTVKQAAAALGMTEAGVRFRLRKGIMRGHEVAPGRYWTVPQDEVERWRERGKLRPGPRPGRRGKKEVH